MNKINPLLLFPIFIITAILARIFHLSDGYNYITGLPAEHNMFWYILIVICVLGVAYAVFCASKFPAYEEIHFRGAFKTKSDAYKMLSVTVAFVMIGVGFFELVMSLIQSTSMPVIMGQSTLLRVLPMLPKLILSLLSILSGGAIIIILLVQLQYKPSDSVAFLSTMPMFWACFGLVLTYNENGANPIVSEFAFDIFAYIATMCALYCFVGFYFGKYDMQKFVFTSLLSVLFSSIALITILYAALSPTFTFIDVNAISIIRLTSVTAMSILMYANTFNLQINVTQEKGEIEQ